MALLLRCLGEEDLIEPLDVSDLVDVAAIRSKDESLAELIRCISNVDSNVCVFSFLIKFCKENVPRS